MSVDVVVVNYRSAPVIARAVTAARELLGEGAGVIVVDNSPGDGAAEAVRAVAPDASVLANRRNRGFAAAVNRAIAVSTADVVLLLNPDVERIAGDGADVEAAFADPRVAAASARLELPDGSPLGNCFAAPRAFDYLSEDLALAQRFPGWGRPRRFRQLDRDPAAPGPVEWTSGACLFLRRAAVGDVGPFDERFFVYCEETDWLVRAARRGWTTTYVPSLLAVHATAGSSPGVDARPSLLLLESQHRYARKHFGPAPAAALRAALAGIDAARIARHARGNGGASAAARARVPVHLALRAPRPPA
ncbi:MAG TPA: glycosyltransferase family 2 protein [Gaiellales bacterium]|nr:glycosyltransferase family 2 protein [Gaiellales bacterium]